MRQVEEVHGLFQFTDDFFSDEDQEKIEELAEQSYHGRYLEEHWYLTVDAVDFDLAKFKIDHFFAKRCFKEAYAAALSSYEHHKQGKMPRELLEILVDICMSLNDSEAADGFMAEVLASGAQDPSIKWLRLRKEIHFGRWEAAYQAGLDYLEFRPHEYRVCLLMERACRQLNWIERADEYAREAATIKHNYLRNMQ